MENFQNTGLAAIYEGKHPYWTDSLFFYRDGTFRRKTSGCAGHYTVNGSKSLTLQWFSWPAERLIRDGEDYLGAPLTLSRAEGQPDLLSLLQPGSAFPPVELPSSEQIRIQLGCGVNMLPGWINLDLPRYDITRLLPWGDECVNAYFLEHVIEHVLPSEAYDFFLEAWRTLKPGGILRLAFPDLLRIAARSTPEYIRFLQDKNWGDGSPGSALRNIIKNHGHRAVWTAETIAAVLQSIGYEVSICSPGESSHHDLQGIESHASQLGHAFNELETSCVEAVKPLNSCQ